jgi:uncharacterized protein (DUF488 family)
MRIFTIGYEGTTMDEFLAALQQAGVERVIDVRALPLSRRPGFSKSPLGGALGEAGIEYVHLKALGTPADGRAAARAGRHSELERIYASQLELPEAIAQGAQMLELARERPSALLCFEREPGECHRTLLLDAVAPNVEVIHLYAQLQAISIRNRARLCRFPVRENNVKKREKGR